MFYVHERSPPFVGEPRRGACAPDRTITGFQFTAGPDAGQARAQNTRRAGFQMEPARLQTYLKGSDYAKFSRRLKLVSVLDISIAMVIGPTPPGTGVIAEHLGATAA
jgi:hypothetical protein